jgi:hypothetical protein
MIINLTSPNFLGIVTGVGECIYDALGQTPAGAPTRYCKLVPSSTIPWDNCDCGGQLALAITQVYGAATFPQPFTGGTWADCKPRWWVAQVLVSVTRCHAAIDDQGRPPSCDAVFADAVILEHDRQAVRQAIACCLSEVFDNQQPTLGAWALGPSLTLPELGGCGGSETTFWIGVNACVCPGCSC